MQEKIDALVGYIQQKCLWQFFSRAWDREENIAGVLDRTRDLLLGATPPVDTDIDRCHLADAKTLSAELRSEFPWVAGMRPDQLGALFQGVKETMMEIAVAKSRNGELYVSYY